MAKRRAKPKRKEKKTIREGIAHIQSTFNNTIVTLTDREGNVLAWASAGTVGFKGTRKGTPLAGQMAAESAARKGMELGLKEVEVRIRGPGSGRETALRSLQAAGLQIRAVRDVTRTPHNGCRPKKKRRV